MRTFKVGRFDIFHRAYNCIEITEDAKEFSVYIDFGGGSEASELTGKIIEVDFLVEYLTLAAPGWKVKDSI